MLTVAVVGIALLVALGFVVAKAHAGVRVAASIFAVVGVAIFSFDQGVAYQRVLFYSSYGSSIRRYSDHLVKLAQADDCDELKQAVRLFDARVGNDPDDAAILQDTVNEILKVGRYYDRKDSATTKPKGSDERMAP